jgi:hypothetical protein
MDSLNSFRSMRALAGVAALVGWFALALQFALLLSIDSPLTVGTRIGNFFSYFTVLSNILAALVLTVCAIHNRSGPVHVFARPAVMAAVAVYMGVTGLVYFFLLSALWNPQGWARVADILLHYVMPVLYLGFWIVFVRKGRLRPGLIPVFLLFPVAYAVYSLIRGGLIGWYPYPFLDLRTHEAGEIVVNALLLTIGFALFAAMLVALDRILAENASAAGPA